MNVQELGVLHQRYVDLSQRFRAAWVYHQFVQSLKKVFQGSAGSGNAEGFQELYAELKEISQSLTASETGPVGTRLDEVEKHLDRLSGGLVEEDNRISPEQLRHFFLRFQRYDNKILHQLARFLIQAATSGGWHADRLDKLDFLITRLGQREVEGQDTFVPLERKELQEIFDSLWALTGAAPPPQQTLGARRRELEEIQVGLERITSLEDLNQEDLLGRFREMKHGLGPIMFEPGMINSVLATNLAFKNLIRRLYRHEERRIIADYQQIFELEGEVPLDVGLSEELGEFRREIERFEQRLQQDDFRLGDLARIRGHVRSLLPQLQDANRPGSPRVELSAAVEASTPAAGDMAKEPLPEEGAEDRAADELFAAEYEEIVQVLGETDAEAPPRTVTLKPAVFALRLEPREVVAVEWADQLPDALPADRLWVRIARPDPAQAPSGRLIEARASGPLAEEALARWRQGLSG